MILPNFSNLPKHSLGLIDQFLGHKEACKTIYPLNQQTWRSYKYDCSDLLAQFLFNKSIRPFIPFNQNFNVPLYPNQVVSATIHAISSVNFTHETGSPETIASKLEDLNTCLFYQALIIHIPVSERLDLSPLTKIKDKALEIRSHLHSHPAWIDSVTLIDLNNRRISSLPKEIGLFRNLNQLYLENNLLNTLPEEIGLLTKLEEIDLRNNRITHLPPEISELTSLTLLDLSVNLLTDIPKPLSYLSKLSQLNLCYNNLKSISISFVNLTLLTNLNLSFNQLTYLPDEFFKLTNLKRFICTHNRLLAIQDDIIRLQKLSILNLQNNCLIFLPKSMGLLHSLKELHVSNNQIRTFPSSLINLSALLNVFSFIDNPIEQIPLTLMDLFSRFAPTAFRSKKRIRFE